MSSVFLAFSKRSPRATFQSVRRSPLILHSIPSRYISSSNATRNSDTVSKLQNAFRDPNSPFYLEPGAEGPADPGAGFVNPEKTYLLQNSTTGDSPTINSNVKPHLESPILLITDEMRAHAHSVLGKKGYDPTSYYEEVVNWGDMDAFKHVNNVRYVRYLESGRIVWMYHLALELGGGNLARDMISGRGVSLILKEISVRYRRPVTYPDTLLIAHRPHDSHPTHFASAGIIWSYAQKTVVATSDSTLVWYDYDRLKKCDPGEAKRSVLDQKIQTLIANARPSK